MMKSDGISISQGEFAVSGDPGVVISTILGSCVATCMWDDTARVGGMNHILVARSTVRGLACDLAGVTAMELLINALVQKGACRSRLKAKVFGGARMVRGLSDIGETNSNFVLRFLGREGIPCLGTCLGGASARNIRFHAAEGRVMKKSLSGALPPPPALPRMQTHGAEFF